MDSARPFLALFCFLSLPKYAQHLTLEEIASAIGFVVFAINESAKLFTLARRKIRGWNAKKRRKTAPLKAAVC